MTNVEKQHWVALIAVEGIGRATFFKVLRLQKKYRISWQEFWVGKYGVWDKLKLNEKQQESIKKFKKEHTITSYSELLAQKQISVVTYKDNIYPKLLQNINDKPPLLFVKSKVAHYWNKLPIAIVGTRKMTAYGELVTKKIARDLCFYGATIVSGFMYGVDFLAHQTAMTNHAKTIAVLGFGFDKMFPKSHQKHFDQMLAKGAIFISEYAPHISGNCGTFPMRNRIIAGMSLATIVTEAASKSGSLITANLAADYGRDVFAVPGSITSLFSEGTRQLVNDGAMLINSGQEVINVLKSRAWLLGKNQITTSKPNSPTRKQTLTQTLAVDMVSENSSHAAASLLNNLQADSLENRILQHLQAQFMSTDQLADILQIHIQKLNVTLGMMTIKGLIKQDGIKWGIASLAQS